MSTFVSQIEKVSNADELTTLRTKVQGADKANAAKTRFESVPEKFTVSGVGSKTYEIEGQVVTAIGLHITFDNGSKTGFISESAFNKNTTIEECVVIKSGTNRGSFRLNTKLVNSWYDSSFAPSADERLLKLVGKTFTSKKVPVNVLKREFLTKEGYANSLRGVELSGEDLTEWFNAVTEIANGYELTKA